MCEERKIWVLGGRLMSVLAGVKREIRVGGSNSGGTPWWWKCGRSLYEAAWLQSFPILPSFALKQLPPLRAPARERKRERGRGEQSTIQKRQQRWKRQTCEQLSLHTRVILSTCCGWGRGTKAKSLEPAWVCLAAFTAALTWFLDYELQQCNAP